MNRKNLPGLYLGRPIMAHKNLVGLYLGWPIMAREILWAFSWASPLWSAKSHGPLAGRPIMVCKILWAFSWAGPFKLVGPCHVSTYHRRLLSNEWMTSV